MTARELADELEVSVRTVYRDAEQLAAAGIPLYGEAGHAGGYQLINGYRTRLTGLTANEARAVFLAGLPGPAAQLGLGEVLAAASRKLRAALPPQLREHAGRVQERFLLDAPGWYDEADHTPHLTDVAAAVWEHRVIAVRYRRWSEPTEVDRRLAPYGLVLKAGRWYLVAAAVRVDPSLPERDSAVVSEPRTYRVDQILALDVLDETYTPPDDFDLAAYWRTATADFLTRLFATQARVRLAPHALARARAHLGEPAARALADSAVTDTDGWVVATVPVESVDHAHTLFLGLGADIEVLAPDELRDRVAATARALAGRYT